MSAQDIEEIVATVSTQLPHLILEVMDNPTNLLQNQFCQVVFSVEVLITKQVKSYVICHVKSYVNVYVICHVKSYVTTYIILQLTTLLTSCWRHPVVIIILAGYYPNFYINKPLASVHPFAEITLSLYLYTPCLFPYTFPIATNPCKIPC